MTDSTWLLPADVITWQENEEPDAPITDQPALQQACNAVAEYVEQTHPEKLVVPVDYDPDDPDSPQPVYTPGPRFLLGAVMFAARLSARRSTVLGVQGYAELGGSPILRTDPDIARLLKLGGFSAFVFGAPSLPVEEVTP